MRTLVSTIIAVAFMLGCSTVGKGPLSFQSPGGWRVAHDKMAGGLHSYTLTATPAEGLLEFSEWPRDGKGVQAAKSPGHEYPAVHFEGENCQGSYVTFETDTNRLTVIIGITVDGRLWTGRFVGSPDAWNQALTVLKSINRDG